MDIALKGFYVRTPLPEEVPALSQWFVGSPLGERDVTYLVAFGQPGDIPLGAVALRPLNASDLARAIGFVIFVRPDCRRRGIGRQLVQHLYKLADRNNALRLELAALIHQDSPENAFYKNMGMRVTRRLRTYVITCERVRKLCEPMIRRAKARRTPPLAGKRIVQMKDVDAKTAAEFFATYYGGYVDQRLDELNSGAIDLEISQACMAGEKMVGGLLARSKPDVTSIMVELIVTAPEYRDGLIALAMIAAGESVASARGILEAVFEGDELHDRFAVGFASRAGAEKKWCRNRYTVKR